MPADEARHRDFAVDDREVADENENADVDAAAFDVHSAAGVDRDSRVGQDLAVERGLRRDQADDERAQTGGFVVARKCKSSVRTGAAVGHSEETSPRVRRRTRGGEPRAHYPESP